MLALVQPGATALAGNPNDFGNEGLIQTPNARYGGEGQLRFGASQIWPYDTVFLSAQPFDWMEATYRYVTFQNYDTSYGADYLDKSIDLKLRLVEEQDWIPQLAVGIQDLGGTGLLSSEFLVASKRFGSLDVSLGYGWGRLGARGDFGNPLGELAESFNEPRQTGAAGEFSLSRLFKGDETALFGGVAWTPGDGPLTLMLEYEGNDYQSEPQGNNLPASTPLNVGVAWRWRWLELGLAHERGNEWSLRANLVGNIERARPPPPVDDPPPTPVGPEPIALGLKPDLERQADSRLLIELRDALARQGIRLNSVVHDADTGLLSVYYERSAYREEGVAMERVARAVASLAPERYTHMLLVSQHDAVETMRSELSRADVRASATGVMAPAQFRRVVQFQAPDASAEAPGTALLEPDFPRLSWSMAPKLRQSVGDPSEPYFAQLWWSADAELRLSQGLDLRGAVGADIVNNFDKLTRESDSKLPHVRSDIADYLKQGQNNIVQLETNYIWSPRRDWTARVSAGLFEEMYGGVAAELLYRPFARDWAVGLNLNRVRQRDFDQLFAFRDYEVSTGHLSFYHEYRPARLRTIFSVGRYLAGDIGATLDISRRFSSGVRLGVFATKTDVSSEEFGEGAFDKGFYISVPMDLFSARSDPTVINFAFRPLTRDGGQKVDDGAGLYGQTARSDVRDIVSGWR